MQRLGSLLAGAALVWSGSVSAAASPQAADSPAAPAQVIGRTAAESGPPEWPQQPEAPAGAPNVLLILTDDVGFGASSTFGGLIPTPTLDALAAQGVLYNRFHTSAICSPTRAALLTGREPHRVGMGNIADFAAGYPGYTSSMPKSAGMVSQVLANAGYATAAIGKWHLTPEWETSAAGPFDRWPTGQGFQYYYGFLAGQTNQYAPALYEGTTAIAPPADDPAYILDRDLADRAIAWVRQQSAIAPQKPFFMYYAPGTSHAPHHAPREWIEKFRGKFDHGWDSVRDDIYKRQKAQGVIPANARLTPRPDLIPAWSSLTADQRRIHARLMEAYAGSLAYFDHEIGRLIESLRQDGKLDNTLVVFIQGDNGGSGEGGVQGAFVQSARYNGFDISDDWVLANLDKIGTDRSFTNYGFGWTWAMNTPFQYSKQIASHFGGTRNGMVVSWPGRTRAPETPRSQFLFVTDVAPTILEAAGVKAPESLGGVKQMSIDGVSFMQTLQDPQAPEIRKTQVFEVLQNIGIYHEGWYAGTTPAAAPWQLLANKTRIENRTWELYQVTRDFSQANNLARKHPAKLQEMKDLFFAEAQRNQILPLRDVSEGQEGRPRVSPPRTTYTYLSGITRVPAAAAPSLYGKSYTISARIVVPQGGANGVLVTDGGRFGGYALYLVEGKPTFHYATSPGSTQYTVRSDMVLPPGEHLLEAVFTSDRPVPGSGGTLTLRVGGTDAATGRIEKTFGRLMSMDEGFDVGEDTLTPINDDYTISNSRFTGELRSLTINIE